MKDTENDCVEGFAIRKGRAARDISLPRIEVYRNSDWSIAEDLAISCQVREGHASAVFQHETTQRVNDRCDELKYELGENATTVPRLRKAAKTFEALNRVRKQP